MFLEMKELNSKNQIKILIGSLKVVRRKRKRKVRKNDKDRIKEVEKT